MNTMERNFIEKLSNRLEEIKDEYGNYEYVKFRKLTDELYHECFELDEMEYKLQYQKLGKAKIHPFMTNKNYTPEEDDKELHEPSTGDYITEDEIAQLESAIANSSIGQDSGLRLSDVCSGIVGKSALEFKDNDKLLEDLDSLKETLISDIGSNWLNISNFTQLLKTLKSKYDGWYYDSEFKKIIKFEIIGMFEEDNIHYAIANTWVNHITSYRNYKVKIDIESKDLIDIDWKLIGQRVATL